MAKIRQSFRNDRDHVVYIQIEPTPERFELEPGDSITLIYDASLTNEVQVDWLDDRLTVWPNLDSCDVEILFNGEPGEERSWSFKHCQDRGWKYRNR